MAEEIAAGLWLLGRYSPFQVGAWVYVHNSEAAMFEMPPFQGKAPLAWDDGLKFVKERNLKVKWLLLSHAHIDHTYGLPYYRKVFPKARLVVHRSFLEWYSRSIFDDIFYDDERVIDVGGEPLFLLHAPKHSPQDTLIFFRGTCCTGDWSLGAAPDCNPLVSPAQKLLTIDRVRKFLKDRDYYVHTVFSAHGNEFRRGEDFNLLLDEMYEHFKSIPPNQWKSSLRRWQQWMVKTWREEEDRKRG